MVIRVVECDFFFKSYSTTRPSESWNDSIPVFISQALANDMAIISGIKVLIMLEKKGLSSHI